VSTDSGDFTGDPQKTGSWAVLRKTVAAFRQLSWTTVTDEITATGHAR
jgi:hypothetical protein